MARLAGFLAVAGLGIGFVVVNKSEVPTALSSLRDANPAPVALAVAFAITYLIAYAGLVWVCMSVTGLRMTFRRAALVGTAAHFYNLAIVNSGGFGGVGVAITEARRSNVPTSTAVVGYLLVSQIGHLTFAIVLGLALLLEFLQGSLSNLELLAAAVFLTYSAGVVASLIAVVTNERLFMAIHRIKNLVVNKGRRLFHFEDRADEANTQTAIELREIIRRLSRTPKSMLLPICFGVSIELVGVATLWAILFAFGVHTGVGTPLTAYAAGVLFSIVGFLPAGIGFAEAGLGLALRRAGVDAPSTVLVVVTFRLLETWLPFAAGAAAAVAVRRGTNIAHPRT